ncbi:MAG: hypothetical protein F6K65_25235 [Moorea sp. SIO3C2]|nr:hypothetical protein [Moorena sp. SIO3C2]
MGKILEAKITTRLPLPENFCFLFSSVYSLLPTPYSLLPTPYSLCYSIKQKPFGEPAIPQSLRT